MIYTRGGRTLGYGGHVENFSAIGGLLYYICLLQLQFTLQNMN